MRIAQRKANMRRKAEELAAGSTRDECLAMAERFMQHGESIWRYFGRRLRDAAERCTLVEPLRLRPEDGFALASLLKPEAATRARVRAFRAKSHAFLTNGGG